MDVPCAANTVEVFTGCAMICLYNSGLIGCAMFCLYSSGINRMCHDLPIQ